MLKIKQYFCVHKEIKIIAEHEHSSQNLWKCPKCQVYVVQHWGIGTFDYCKEPNISGWKYLKREGANR